MKDSPTGSQAIEWCTPAARNWAFEPDAGMSAYDASTCGIPVNPLPAFVEVFLQASPERHSTRGQRIRTLYGFLCEALRREAESVVFCVLYLDEKACLPKRSSHRPLSP